MKCKGIIRRLDDLGRLVIPKEIRDKYKLQPYDQMEIYCIGNKIYINKYEKSCSFCGNTQNLKEYKEGCICKNCLGEIKK